MLFSPALAGLLFLTMACSKQAAEPDLPLPSQSGLNTFGCRINGKNWVPGAAKPADRGGELVPVYDYQSGFGGVLEIRAKNTKTNNFSIYLFSNRVDDEGVYPFQRADLQTTQLIVTYKECRYYSQDSTAYRTGNLTLTRLDLKTGIIAGTFAFTIAQTGCDTLRVTDGRFDLRLN